jgi:phosphate transport system protein
MSDNQPHTVKSFDQDIDQLRSIITQMGGLCEAQIVGSITALSERNIDAAMRIVADDARIDALEAAAEKMAVEIIARRQPLADDLREIIAALKISAVLERIGDYAKNIAKRASALALVSPIEPVVIIPEMARVVAGMVKDVLDAYVDRDDALAIEVCERDQRVDEYYNSLFRTLLTFMMENPQHITPSTHLLFVAKNLERIGDHATNVGEMVHYALTGQHIMDRPKSDTTSTLAVEDR